MGNLVFQATLGGQVNLVGPNTASTFNLNVPAVAGTLVTTGDTGTVTNTMCATSVYTAPGTIGSGTPNTGAFTTLSATGVASFAAGSAAAPAITRTGDTDTGIFFPAANTLAFSTNGTEDARFDSAGNLLVGTTTAVSGAKVTVSGSVAASAGASVAGNAWGVLPYTASSLVVDTNAGTSRLFSIGSDASTKGAILFYQATSSGSATQAMTLDASGNLGVGTTSPSTRLHVVGPGNPTLTLAGSDGAYSSIFNMNSSSGGVSEIAASQVLKLSTTGSERARIDSSGNLLVGTTTSLANGATISGGNGPQLALNTTTNFTQFNWCNSGTQKAAIFFDNSQTRFVVQNASAGVYLSSGATSWTSNSDERKKDIIEPIENATEKLSSLRTVIGKYKTDAEGVRRSFLIAQDVLNVFPEAVDATNPDDLGVAYSDLIPLLVKAIQEQQALITSLTARITALEQA